MSYIIQTFDNSFLAHCNSVGVQLMNRITANVYEGGQLKKAGGRKYWQLSLPEGFDVAKIGIDKELASTANGQRILGKSGQPFTIRYMKATTLNGREFSESYQIHAANVVTDLETSIDDTIQSNASLTTSPQVSPAMAPLLAQMRAMGNL